MTDTEMLEIFLEETGFSREQVYASARIKKIQSPEKVVSLKRYGLFVRLDVGYRDFVPLIFMSDKFDPVNEG